MEKSGLRERKKRERHEALIDATHALVREHGSDGVTVEMICDAVGVSSRTFFNYFESKEHAILGLTEVSVDDTVAATFVAGGPTGRFVDDTVVVLRDLLSAPALSGHRLAAAMELARAEPRLLVRHVAWMEDQRSSFDELLARRRATTGEHVASELVGVVMMSAVRGAFMRWEQRGADGTPADHVEPVLAEIRTLLA
ncbi:DNA-binding transcriptional regulator, AcrR family [Paraoerskovia marina]|uniref:DNA-binding transcriptional regulator, AcrR family n=1 Tax=Paraoerskovia marina TaxID=545619 RepID=A0A1H1U420_9CELL|nr:TetR/AcrR family transcriptional regulator [Paraoerskovia marina]SDS67091.1 DNA-binding transcriptional regulator, AcrR family [Paraoerskovia marina]